MTGNQNTRMVVFILPENDWQKLYNNNFKNHEFYYEGGTYSRL